MTLLFSQSVEDDIQHEILNVLQLTELVTEWSGLSFCEFLVFYFRPAIFKSSAILRNLFSLKRCIASFIGFEFVSAGSSFSFL